jgi:hypothetical protein
MSNKYNQDSDSDEDADIVRNDRGELVLINKIPLKKKEVRIAEKQVGNERYFNKHSPSKHLHDSLEKAELWRTTDHLRPLIHKYSYSHGEQAKELQRKIEHVFGNMTTAEGRDRIRGLLAKLIDELKEQAKNSKQPDKKKILKYLAGAEEIRVILDKVYFALIDSVKLETETYKRDENNNNNNASDALDELFSKLDVSKQ